MRRVASHAICVAILLRHTVIASAQPDTPRFEVASIKPSAKNALGPSLEFDRVGGFKVTAMTAILGGAVWPENGPVEVLIVDQVTFPSEN